MEIRLFLTTLLLCLLGFSSCEVDPEISPCDGTSYMIVEKMPEFPGGELALMNFVYDNLVYPQEAIDNEIQGRVIVSFTINCDGSTSQHKILSDIGGGCGEEALKMLDLMPVWTPGMQNEKPIPVHFNLPVKFELEG